MSTYRPVEKHAASVCALLFSVCFLSVVRAGCVCAMETLHYGYTPASFTLRPPAGEYAHTWPMREPDNAPPIYVFAPRVFFIMLILRFCRAGMRWRCWWRRRRGAYSLFIYLFIRPTLLNAGRWIWRSLLLWKAAAVSFPDAARRLIGFCRRNFLPL